MSTTKLTVDIKGHEALPVRAIPYVVPWRTLAPDELAMQLAGQVAFPFPRLENLIAYSRRDGEPKKIEPDEWTSVVTKFKAHEAQTRDQFPNESEEHDAQGYAAWQESAALILPEGVFVCLDEFERAYQFYANPPKLLTDSQCESNDEDKDKQKAQLNLDPGMVDDQKRQMILAGFAEAARESNPGDHMSENKAQVTGRFIPTETKPVPEKVGVGDTGISETITTHKLENRRTHPLAAVITSAKKSAVDATDYQSVWAALVKLAELPSRPAPILGYAETDGIKYQADTAPNGVKFFNKDALRKRMWRAVAKTYPTTPTSAR